MLVALADLPPPPPGRTGWPWTEAGPAAPAGVTWPRISVVTPSYNQAQFLEETIRSVLLQGYPELEYFVIDGGSSDASVAIIERYAPWLTAWESQRDRGQSDAVNRGMARASGQLVAWLNSDDTYLPGALHAAGAGFRERPEAALHGGCVFVDGEGRRLYRLAAGRVDRARLLTRSAYLSQPATFLPGAIWRELGGLDESLHYGMDLDLWLRLLALGVRFECLPEDLATYRLHPDAKCVSSTLAARREVYAICARYLAASPDASELRRSFDRRHATFMCQDALAQALEHRRLRALRTLWSAFRLYPRACLSGSARSALLRVVLPSLARD